ncbi:MAG: phenylacetate--CoA ligase family protein, partial [Eubacteriales bacterium]|nr:phenylacetate--CoA ligase family protein [Eubacteriales bacterium]
MDIIKPFIEKILYPAMEKKNKNQIRHNLAELKSQQKLSPETLQEIRKEKLKKLLIDCVENVPAYTSYAFLLPEIEADPLHAILKFPILSKADFRKAETSYLNPTVPKSSLIANRTGGSTSEPVKFYMDRSTVEYYEAARWRGLSWWGITPGSRSVMIWGNPLELDRYAEKKYKAKEKWLKNRIIISAYSLIPESMPEYIKQISAYKPEYIYGYPSALHAFSVSLLKQGFKLPFVPKAVVSTAETLFHHQRETIEQAFQCQVVNEYGARDAGILAYQCPCGGMHISCENALLEVIDPQTLEPVENGTSGLLAITDLNNHAMPRLRYLLGDRAALSDKQCECGLTLPLLEKIDGREDDMFVTVEGKLIHGHAFNHISRSMGTVDRFQIVQLRPDLAELKIIPIKNTDEKDVERFIAGVRELLPGTQIDVELVNQIPVSPSGKFR